MKAFVALVCLTTAATAFPVLMSQTHNSTGVAIKAINEVAGAPSTTRLPNTFACSLARALALDASMGLSVPPAQNTFAFSL